ncbi:laminin subunit alpha-3 [Plakobranchus ocellatus]|uniref:Laminin subunit alpha-3 n=1 Tax=Plakobranchus ocellatus TaxID=259542 RepID=A0AAV4BS00_9GAST|nr:laminin subunit alpha-3 [Plakobranchus ocellatus]
MATGAKMPVGLVCCVLLLFPLLALSQVLTPPTFNLAQNRRITATATCGVGVSEEELFCRLTPTSNVGAEAHTLIQGQLCDYCNPAVAEKSHGPELAIDGTERWWQSPPLSRGPELNKVNVTLSLGQEFHVAYVFIKMANSPRPGVWVLERSTDFGQSWKPWQYFADTPSACLAFFNTTADLPLMSDDQVLCTTQFSKVVPVSDGEIVVSILEDRPNAKNFSYTPTLQEWTKATDIQLRLLQTKTLKGDLMDVARRDPIVFRRYYYSIKDISVGGRCVCNGHAETCEGRNQDTHKLVCNCVANTCGDKCEYCCPGFVQKRWRGALVDQPFECEPCNCHGHTTDCVFVDEVERNRRSLDIYGNYEGGGVCQNCRDNTEGINCENCVSGYYRPYGVPRNATDACRPCVCDYRVSTGACEEGSGRCLCRPEFTGRDCDRCSSGYYGYPQCIPCDCDASGTEGNVCTVDSGACPCKYNYAGTRCDQCAPGYYNFPDCVPCQCNPTGSQGSVCDQENGQCQCYVNYGGRDCSECSDGHFMYPECRECYCDPAGCVDEICDKQDGTCLCKANYTGSRCDNCEPGFFNYPYCQECECESPGSQSPVCSSRGQCPCNRNYGGRACNRCGPGFYKYPDCGPCRCNLYGSVGETCDQVTGQCRCRSNFVGVTCNECAENFYNYPVCEVCNCNPDGAKEIPGYPLGGCGIVTVGRLCECKDKVVGRICDQCIPGYWNLNRNNPEGCEECGCYIPGTLTDVNRCDMETGQCECKTYVTGRNCDRCRPGFYNLQEKNPFGCQGCNCNRGGSLSDICDPVTGQCRCKQRVTGRRCDQPLSGYFVPYLHQYKFELEDGLTPEGAKIRYGYDQRIFPDFSWRGYAILTEVQPEVQLVVDIRIPSFYQIIFRYVNREENPVKGTVVLSPESPTDTTQQGEATFLPGKDPSFTGVSSGGIQAYVLNPGRWTISTNVPSDVFLDYFVLIPQSFYEASLLQDPITDPCLAVDDPGPCIAIKYPDLSGFPKGDGRDGYHVVDGQKEEIDTETNSNLTNNLDSPGLALLTEEQKSFSIDLIVPIPDNYILIVNYHNALPITQLVDVEVAMVGETVNASVILSSCPYSTLCRRVLKGPDGLEGVFNISNGYAALTFTASEKNEEINAAIDSVYAIPLSKWGPLYTRPQILCIKINGVCVVSSYGIPVGTILIQFEAFPNEALISVRLPADILDPSLGLVNLNDSNQIVNQTSCPISDNEDDRECTIEPVTQAVPLELVGQVPKPGDYILIVHYYMPTETNLYIPVTLYTDGKEIPGMFSPTFCPNSVGCRVVITFDPPGQSSVRLLGSDIRVLFNGTMGHDIWLDYLMVVPIRQFSNSYLDLLPIDNSQLFITKCVDPGFQLNLTDPFCLGGAFTLTTDFNNGALDCDCDPDGSVSFTCSDSGGSCVCKPNVIGRSCTACAQDYYGFPDCKPCNCRYGICHEVTGQCICPPNVEGDQCDRCKSGAYGYDPIIGCQLCNCNPAGTINADMSCDQTTGQCNCKQNVDGRRCDTCLPGYHSYPYCDNCGCDTRGTIAEICDQRTAECLCKDNVQGQYCDQCADGMFSLTQENPKGCIKCFCFGHTTRCDSAGLSWDTVTDMLGWNITSLIEDNVEVTMDEMGTTLVVNSRDGVLDDPGLFWIAPPSYIGDKTKSYGGKLEYTVFFTLPRDDESNGIIREDIILTGNNMTIVHFHDTQPAPNYPFKFEVELQEYNFRHVRTNAPVSREQFMMLLHSMDSLVIRASYFSKMEQIRLKEVTLQVASEQGQGELAESVEMCQCPPTYKGLSCESCASGSYRPSSSTPQGICVKCNCHGHTDQCDINTGECFNCQNNTFGRNCDQCLAGYHGDPLTGPCSICSCPLPFPSNNFATACTADALGYTESCDCQPGYIGTLCEICSPGYYGDPMRQGEYCKPCECSGNIDLNNPNSCDRFTGACLVCENYSTGPNCEECRNWYWGDAVTRKDCQPCVCDPCGTERCNNTLGTCECKMNVVGPSCNECAPNTWGFDYCSGCEECLCGEGSASEQCDLRTGRCECLPGVEGEKCDRCQANHWNYGPTGCQECDCVFDGAVGCDSETGRCQCLPGVTGEKCDLCLPRWVLVANRGCQECDYCVHLLIDDLDALANSVTVVSRSLADVSVGVGAFNQLARYNDTVEMMRPGVEDLQNMDTDEFNKSVAMLHSDINNVSMQAQTLQDESRTLASKADRLPEDVKTLGMNVQELQKMSRESVRLSNAAVKKAQEVQRSFSTNVVKNIEPVLTESQAIVKEMQDRNFTSQNDSVEMEHQNAEEFKNQIENMTMEAESSLNQVTELDAKILDIEERLQDLDNSSRSSENDADTAMSTTRRLKAVQLEELAESLQKIEDTKDAPKEKLKEAALVIKNAEELLNAAEQNMTQGIESQSSSLDEALSTLEAHINEMAGQMDNLFDLTNQSQVHAENLKAAAAELEEMYASTRNRSEDPVRAGQAYQKIESGIEDARISADQAVENAELAKNESENIHNNVSQALLDSQALLEQAQELLEMVQNKSQGGLNKDALLEAQEIHMETKDLHQAVLDKMETLKGLSTDSMSTALMMKLNETMATLDQTEQLSQSVIDMTSDMNEKNDYIVLNTPKAKDEMRRAEEFANSAEKAQPEIEDTVKMVSNLTAQVEEKSRMLGINVDALREKIAQARYEANRIKVGMQFLGNTTVTLRNPPELSDTGSYSTVSLFLKTAEPDALLMYAGNNQNLAAPAVERKKRSISFVNDMVEQAMDEHGEVILSRQTRQVPDFQSDYLALEMVGGLVVFTVNLGSGAVRLTSTRQINDGNWHQIIAQRIGKTATLTVKSDSLDDDVVKGTTPGTFVVLELNTITTHLLVGGLPQDFTLPQGISTNSFVGSMEELKFDEAFLGLWNFVQAQNNYQGEKERDFLRKVFVEDGVRFNGKGYAVLSKSTLRFRPDRTYLSLAFKTYAERGLIFYMGKNDFFSLEVSDGYLFFRFDVGDGATALRSNLKYSDGEWHKVVIERKQRDGLMIIGEKGEEKYEELNVVANGTLNNLETPDDIFVGGVDNILVLRSMVMRHGFDGCLKDVSIAKSAIDLFDNKRANGYEKGCPEKITHIAGFPGSRSGYLGLNPVNVGGMFDLTFKMKTMKSTAFFMMVSDKNQSVHPHDPPSSSLFTLMILHLPVCSPS